jgi:hypothetical protein
MWICYHRSMSSENILFLFLCSRRLNAVKSVHQPWWWRHKYSPKHCITMLFSHRWSPEKIISQRWHISSVPYWNINPSKRNCIVFIKLITGFRCHSSDAVQLQIPHIFEFINTLPVIISLAAISLHTYNLHELLTGTCITILTVHNDGWSLRKDSQFLEIWRI